MGSISRWKSIFPSPAGRCIAPPARTGKIRSVKACLIGLEIIVEMILSDLCREDTKVYSDPLATTKTTTAGVKERLGKERNIWIATVRRDGRPHIVPVWFACVDDRIYVCIEAQSVKGRNLRSGERR